MAVFITGDVHGMIGVNKFDNHSNPAKAGDTVIVCGDFGLLWDGSEQERNALFLLDHMPFTTLFVDGNHENFPMINAFPVEEWCGGRVHRIGDKVRHLMRGEIFTIEGMRFFTFGGADSGDKQRRMIGTAWWPEEMPNWSEMDNGINNLSVYFNKVDFILTHTANETRLGRPEREVNRALNKYFEFIGNNTHYKVWFCGHMHKDTIIDNKLVMVFDKFVEVTPDTLDSEFVHI